jgi:pimeloyl-ACP methyl ester carboxylesterase
MTTKTFIEVDDKRRKVEYLHNSSRSKKAIVLHHGTPGSCHLWSDLIDAGDAEFFLVAISRPGYGGSDALHNRSVISIAKDISAILDQHDVEEFVSIGWSGGGPHALSTAFDSRCRGVVLVAGMGPHGLEGFDFFEGMTDENREEFSKALYGREEMTIFLKGASESLRRISPEGMVDLFGNLLTGKDREVVKRSELGGDIAASFRHGVQNGCAGWVDDDIALVHPWGFDLASIKCPVSLLHGDEDRVVPVNHSVLMAREIPAASLRQTTGDGHFSILSRFNHEIFSAAKLFLV